MSITAGGWGGGCDGLKLYNVQEEVFACCFGDGV